MEGLTRCPRLDRPEIILPQRDMTLNELVGFTNDKGAEITMTPEYALQLGLLAEGWKTLGRITSENYIKQQNAIKYGKKT